MDHVLSAVAAPDGSTSLAFSADALEIVKECMEEPFDGFGLKPLRVRLEVDAKSAKTWFQAK